MTTNQQHALSDKARTDAEARKRENAELAKWLGIEPKWDYDISIVEPIYPALATPEGFWLLWDALIKKRFLPRVVPMSVVGSAEFDAWIIDRYATTANTCDAPEAALYAAAVALWRRETGG